MNLLWTVLVACAAAIVVGGVVWIAYTASVAIYEGSWRRRIRR